MLVGALILALVALLAVAVVAWPLIRPEDGATPGEARAEERRAIEEDLQRSLAAIRELDMDHRAGNLSRADFDALDARERARAVELMRRRDDLGQSS